MSTFLAPLIEVLESLTDATHTVPWVHELNLCEDADTAPWRATIELDQKDGVFRIGLRFSHLTETWCHTACDICLEPDGPKLRAAFSVDIQNYALRQDLTFQDEVTQHLACALDRISCGPLHNAGLGDELRAQGKRSADRLTALWSAQRERSMGADRLSYLVEGSKKNVWPALAAPSTRPGNAHPVGVRSIGPGYGFSTIERFVGKIRDLGYYTPERLKETDQFSAQERFDILQGRGSLHDEAMREFHKVRLKKALFPTPFQTKKVWWMSKRIGRLLQPTSRFFLATMDLYIFLRSEAALAGFGSQ